MGSGIGKTIGHLWLKTDFPDGFTKFIELILIIVTDDGVLVYGTHNTIAIRVDNNLVSLLFFFSGFSGFSGLLTIGNYFGGAQVCDSEGVELGLYPEEFVDSIKKNGQVIGLDD